MVGQVRNALVFRTEIAKQNINYLTASRILTQSFICWLSKPQDLANKQLGHLTHFSHISPRELFLLANNKP
jgi:hypothetical protein